MAVSIHSIGWKSEKNVSPLCHVLGRIKIVSTSASANFRYHSTLSQQIGVIPVGSIEKVSRMAVSAYHANGRNKIVRTSE